MEESPMNATFKFGGGTLDWMDATSFSLIEAGSLTVIGWEDRAAMVSIFDIWGKIHSNKIPITVILAKHFGNLTRIFLISMTFDLDL
jgi:hypothetical protein